MTSITEQLRNVCNSPFDRDQAIILYRTLKGKGPKKNKSNEDLFAILRYISDMLQVMDDSEKTSSRCAYDSSESGDYENEAEKTSSRCAYDSSESGDSENEAEKPSSLCAYDCSESGDSENEAEKTSSRCAQTRRWMVLSRFEL
jgi:hypothetical protein